MEEKERKILHFRYTDRKGITSDCRVVFSKEEETQFHGFREPDHLYRTYIKDRVDEFYPCDVVLSPPPPTPPPRMRADQLEVCFTGFSKKDRAALEMLATERNMKVRKDVTDNLNYLVCGDNAGPTKIEKAKDGNVTILSEEGFHHLVDHGILPD